MLAKKSILKKITIKLLRFLLFLVTLPLLIALITITFFIFRGLAEKTGLLPVENSIAGTGSMYPTFPKGIGKTNQEKSAEVVASAKFRVYPGGLKIGSNLFFGYSLKRGDIVSFSNDKTKEVIQKEATGSLNTYFVKRVIGLAGETIEIRNGFVLINGKPLDEPYVAAARSTYGGDFLQDCKGLTIPEKKVFVMGDNRKGSNDSRFDIGLVDFKDIDSVIPLSWQSSAPEKKDYLKKAWRDTKNDYTNSQKSILNTKEFIDLLNAKRNEAAVAPLKYQEKLSKSASLRADAILKFNDLSFEATRSGYTMEKAMLNSGYSNIIWGEAPTLGFYTADELIENFFSFPKVSKFLLNKDYQEAGISTKIGEINGCPTQVVVAHFAGYVPPSYSQKDKESWQKLINNIDEILPGWENIQGQENINQTDLKKLIDLMRSRRENAKRILKKIENNEWLTKEEKRLVEEDNNIYSQIEELAKKLNNS